MVVLEVYALSIAFFNYKFSILESQIVKILHFIAVFSIFAVSEYIVRLLYLAVYQQTTNMPPIPTSLISNTERRNSSGH